MTWLAWRQFRAPALAGAICLAAFAVYLVVLGLQIRESADVGAFRTRLYVVDAVVLVAPGLLGVFWGAPLVSREFEAGTHRLVWSQSISRRRWLAVKLLVVGLGGMVAAGLLSALVTWAAGPYDEAVGDRFTALVFGARNLAPVAYAGFATVLGAVVGLVLRRSVPAMALTILIFVVVQVAMPTLVRPHFGTPVTGTAPLTAQAVRNLTFLGADASIRGLQVPGGWVVSTGGLLTAADEPVDRAAYNRCVLGGVDDTPDCLAALDLHVAASYHPADRYWPFQLVESAIYAGLTLLLAALGGRLIRGRPRRGR